MGGKINQLPTTKQKKCEDLSVEGKKKPHHCGSGLECFGIVHFLFYLGNVQKHTEQLYPSYLL